MTSQSPQPLEVLFSYAHEDEGLRDELAKHLKALEDEWVVRAWYDRDIVAGQKWDDEIDARLNSADIILLLVSPDFLASDYCRTVEIKRALERDAAGEASVIPVILRPCPWRRTVLGSLQALPTDGKPVTLWTNIDEAFLDVADGIGRAIEELRSKHVARPKTPEEKEEAAGTAFIPRPPIIGFVARRDSQGRDIVERLKDELAPGRHQPVTLSGPGGIGKTTLAAEAARALQGAYEDRIVWSSADGRADFSFLSMLDDIATQLGRAELRTLAPAEKEEQVRVLAAGALVILDNYETVAAAEQKRVEEWFKRTQCSALFTSRPRVPDTVFVPVSAMSREEAAEFLEKLTVQTQDPQLFTPEVRERVYETAEANPHVMQWVVGQIDEARVPDTVFEELTEGEGDAAERVFERSFNLPQLGEDGRDALLALSLFAPSASREALAQAAGFGDDWTKRLDEAVRNLHALWLVKGVDGYRRLAVEGLTRGIAAARLSEDPRADEFRRRFVAYFLRYAAEREERTPENYDALEAEKDNLLGAADAAFTCREWGSLILMAHNLTKPATDNTGMLVMRGHWDEAVRLGEQALQAAHSSQDEAAIATLSFYLAVRYKNRGEFAKSRHLYTEGLEIRKRRGDKSGVALTMWGLGSLASAQRNFAEAKGLLSEAQETFRELGDEPNMASVLHTLGNVAYKQGERGEARRLYNESLEFMKKFGKQHGVAATLHNLAVLARENKERAEARRLFNEGLTIERSFGNQSVVALMLNSLARLAEDEGDRAEAARLYREALSIFERLGSPKAEIARENLARVEGEGS